jgi:hypothetical protein
MKNLVILAMITSCNCFCQAEKKNEVLLEDTVYDYVVTKLNSLDVECLSSIKICHNEYDCKGFITEIDTLVFDESKINVRAEIMKSDSGLFTIRYKYRASIGFITDTVEILCLNNFSSMSFPQQTISLDMFNNRYLIGSFMPASTDERDVVFIKELEDKIILYERN